MGKVDETGSAISESIVVESVLASKEEKDESPNLLVSSISTSGPDAIFFGIYNPLF
jgi:hypothetical protein